ncbi:MAG TPA: hypothetical protein PKY20_03970, partial [Methanothrix sp.]|nr:hypothetical protein [Methanothrix sp.]
DAHKYMAFWYEHAVDEQKRELREYKKKIKTHRSPIETVHLTIKEGLSQVQGEVAKPIEI